MAAEKDSQGAAPTDAQDSGQQSGSGEGTRMFTQEELNAIVADRLRRESKKFADYDDLKAAKGKLDAIEQERMDDLTKAEKRAVDAEAARDDALQRTNDVLLRSAVWAEAAKVGAAHPEDAFHLADMALISINDDGVVSGAGEAVKQLVDANRLVLATKLPTSLDGGAGSGTRTGERQKATVDVRHAAAALRSTGYLQRPGPDGAFKTVVNPAHER